MVNNKKQKNILLAALLFILLCYPVFSIFNKVKFIVGIPMLYVYIFVAWVIAIVLLIVSVEAKPIQKIKNTKNE
jgi:hypothetical protein